MLRIKEFIKDYRLPIITTGILLILVLGLGLLRVYERSVLAGVLDENFSSGQDSTSLLSNDKIEDPQKNEDSQEEQPTTEESVTETITSPETAAQTPFTISTGTAATVGTGAAPPATPPASVPTSPPVIPAFGAAIDYFRHDGTANIPCTIQFPLGLGGICSKKYIFSAGVNAQNGPGTVSYSWRSSISGANESKSFPVSSGNSFTTLQKEIIIPCTQSGPFTLQLRLTSPTQISSQEITVQHKC